MSNFKITPNTINQLISAVLLALTANGLGIDAQATADQITSAITTAQYSMLFMIGFNLVTAVVYWVKTLKDKETPFWSFLHSKNWWLTFANGITGLLVLTGLNANVDAAPVVEAAFAGNNVVGLIASLVVNVLFPIIEAIVQRPKKPVFPGGGDAQPIGYTQTRT